MQKRVSYITARTSNIYVVLHKNHKSDCSCKVQYFLWQKQHVDTLFFMNSCDHMPWWLDLHVPIQSVSNTTKLLFVSDLQKDSVFSSILLFPASIFWLTIKILNVALSAHNPFIHKLNNSNWIKCGVAYNIFFLVM